MAQTRPAAAARGRRMWWSPRASTPRARGSGFPPQALVLALERAGAEVTVLTTGCQVPARQRAAAAVSRWPVRETHRARCAATSRTQLRHPPRAAPDAAAHGRARARAAAHHRDGRHGRCGAAPGAVHLLCRRRVVRRVDSVEGVPPRALHGALAEKTVWKRASRVLTISPGCSTPRGAVGHGPPGHGRQRHRHRFVRDQGEDGGEQGPYFVYAGTVSEWQGAEVFLDAFARVRAGTRRPGCCSSRRAPEGTARGECAMRGSRDRVPGQGPALQIAAHLRGAVAGLSSITPARGTSSRCPRRSTPPPPPGPRDPRRGGRRPRSHPRSSPGLGLPLRRRSGGRREDRPCAARVALARRAEGMDALNASLAGWRREGAAEVLEGSCRPSARSLIRRRSPPRSAGSARLEENGAQALVGLPIGPYRASHW